MINNMMADSESKQYWAFAVDTMATEHTRRRLAGAPRRDLQRYAITACSRQARELGIHAGMSYGDARKLAPGLRVIVCNR